MICEGQIETKKVDPLKRIIDSLLIKEKVYQSEISILKEQVRYLQGQLFGRKSEKISSDDGQRSLFETPEQGFPIVEQPEDDDMIEVPGHKRNKRGRKPIPENLPRIEVVHDVGETEKLCECGCEKTCIGPEVSEQLDIIPATIQVIRNIRLKYACKNCEGVESDGPTVTIARMPEQLIPKSIGTPGLIAFVIAAKFVDALPFYRQEKQFLRIGVKLSRATMCNWAQKIAESCEILLRMLKEEILSGPLINIDETPVQVLKEPGKTGLNPVPCPAQLP
jgi:transposase